MANNPIENPTLDAPPKQLMDRSIFVQVNTPATFRLMHDSKDSNRTPWYETSADPTRARQPVPAVFGGNEVMYLVGGQSAFREMVAAIKTAQSDKHFIYLLGWWLTDSFEMIPGDATSTISNLFREASLKGVQIRAMLWDQPKSQNNSEVDNIRKLPTGAAVLDNRTLNLGAHHQKILLVNGTNGLIGFCGGVDINPDRIHPRGFGPNAKGDTDGAPLHDVHCRIQGPSASSLLRVFVQRWLDHPDNNSAAPLLNATPPNPQSGTQFVQIGRTFANGTTHASLSPSSKPRYDFAPQGEQTAKRMILKAIGAARRFIYVEDQYLVSLEIRDALISALPNIQHLTILIPHGSISSLPQGNFRRQQFVAPLRTAGGTKVRVFNLSPPGSAGTYVHAKTWLIDDKFAIIGSANCNRRGYTHDSEVTAGIFDESSDDHAAWHFAHRLRVKLWAQHLSMDHPTGHAELADGVASAIHWLSPPPGARIAPFDENRDIEMVHTDYAWNGTEDPDGS